jgi:hypothetical protein
MRQRQTGGDQSLNVQGENVTINYGLSVEDVRSIALDVFRANFHELAAGAEQTARKRAEELIDRFLTELQKRNPEGLQTARDPDMQYALFLAQREYARVGDPDLGELLVDLMVDRTAQPKRSLLQIVLNESIYVVPKLTASQIAALSLLFLLKYANSSDIRDPDAFTEYLHTIICPILELVPTGDVSYQHLEYAGCGTVGNPFSLRDVFVTSYPGLFSKGFSAESVPRMIPELEADSRIFRACFNDGSKIQVDAITESEAREKAAQLGLDKSIEERVVNLLYHSVMGPTEMQAFVIQLEPCSLALFELWESTMLKNMTLSSVGMAIGHSNLRHTFGERSDLSDWINGV